MAQENVSKALFEANAALNAQEFANRQILLKGIGTPTAPAPFGAMYIDQSATPPKLYRQMDSGVASNWVAEGTGSGNDPINGAVFITDIEPQNASDNVGQKVFSSDGNVLESAISNTDLIRVHVLAALGHSNYKPDIQVEGQTISLIQDEDQSIWTGSIDIDLKGATTLTATHEDGASHEVTITPDVGAEITNARFSGGYPAGQSELKAGDIVQVQVDSDIDMTRIEVLDFGVSEGEVFDFSATTSTIINLTIADRGNTAQAVGIQLRAMNENGSFGSVYDTTLVGSDDGLHVMMLNNLHPSGSIDRIEYPVGQMALKDSEQAMVEISASDYDTILYASPNAELDVVDPETFNASKAFSRIGGDYNVSTQNMSVTLTRASNGATTIMQDIVNIAHVVPQVQVVEPETRLRSGGNHGTSVQNHSISLISDQKLIEAPVISVPEGTLEATMLDSGDQQTWTQNLRIHDNDLNGVYQFSLTTAKNLAGKTISTLTGDRNYEIGGFVERTITVPAFERELDLLTYVSDATKVVARDKDLALLTYKADTIDALKTYTLTEGGGVLNATGNHFYWTDDQAVNNNTTGLATITIEEIV